jgi:hypothetical protein
VSIFRLTSKLVYTFIPIHAMANTSIVVRYVRALCFLVFSPCCLWTNRRLLDKRKPERKRMRRRRGGRRLMALIPVEQQQLLQQHLASVEHQSLTTAWSAELTKLDQLHCRLIRLPEAGPAKQASGVMWYRRINWLVANWQEAASHRSLPSQLDCQTAYARLRSTILVAIPSSFLETPKDVCGSPIVNDDGHRSADRGYGMRLEGNRR